MNTQELREIVRSTAEAAVAAVHPSRCIPDAVRLERNSLLLGDVDIDLGSVSRVLVVGFGKASAAMASALEEILGGRIAAGFVITADGYRTPTQHIEIAEAAHPLPDRRGRAAADKLLRLVESATEHDLVLALVSGGGSALLTLPQPGIALEDLERTQDLLLRSGAPITEMNAVRKHLSRVKGGRLATSAYPARVISLILSDVPGDAVDVIASGPTTADPTTYVEALGVLARRNLLERVPEAVRRLLEDGAQGAIEETPKPDDPLLSRAGNILVSSGVTAAREALRFAAQEGFHAEVLPLELRGEAREAGRAIASLARGLRLRSLASELPQMLVGAGETTVTVLGRGRGGRNQELSLAAASEIDGLDGAVICALGTDGRDGPTDAAGGLVDGGTAARIRAAGIDSSEALAANDSYRALAASGDLLITGATYTNVSDLALVAASG